MGRAYPGREIIEETKAQSEGSIAMNGERRSRETAIQDLVKTIPNTHSLRTYTVTFTYPAFRCRYEMEPEKINFATLTINYAPNKLLFDFPSLMTYLRNFEDTPISLESAANRILDELFEHLQPIWMRVEMRTEREHGVVIEIVAEQGERPFLLQRHPGYR